MHNVQCLEAPVLLNKDMVVNTHMQDYTDVYKSISSLLEQIVQDDESIEDGISYIYEPEIQTWKVKYVNLDGIIELYIMCFWDTPTQEHVIEIRRVRGTNQRVHNGRKLYGLVKNWFAEPNAKPFSPKVSRISMHPPEIKMPNDSPIQFKLPKDKQILIWESLTIYKRMAVDRYYETRVSCIEGICSLLRKSIANPEVEDTIRTPGCLELLEETLYILAEDTFEDVRELAQCAIKYVPAN